MAHRGLGVIGVVELGLRIEGLGRRVEGLGLYGLGVWGSGGPCFGSSKRAPNTSL